MSIHSRQTRLITTKVFKISINEICESLHNAGINIPTKSMHTARLELDEDADMVYLCFTDEQDEALYTNVLKEGK